MVAAPAIRKPKKKKQIHDHAEAQKEKSQRKKTDEKKSPNGLATFPEVGD